MNHNRNTATGYLDERFRALRSRLDRVFADDTANAPRPIGCTPSAGHCAVVSMLIKNRWHGAEYVSAVVDGQSHWFSRVNYAGRWFDVDLTGDQFGAEPVRVGEPYALWPETRARSAADVSDETVTRFLRLQARLDAIESLRPWSAP